jgi:valyl-tRNA synthetase
MSKSLGNSPDPLKLIKQYGADGVRTGMLFSSPAGNDLLFDEKLLEQGQKFSNKIWNAFRLIKGWEVKDVTQPTENKLAIDWFEASFDKSMAELEDHFSKFRISDALMTVYKLMWNDFCSWYLEWIKPGYGDPVDRKTYDRTIGFLENLVKILHPFMPFISEEIWHAISDRETGNDLIVARWPACKSFDEDVLQQAELLFEIISQIRNIRNTNQLSLKEKLPLVINGNESDFQELGGSLIKMAKLSKVDYSSNKPDQCYSFVIKSSEFYIETSTTIDADVERESLQKELRYTRGFLDSVVKKLSNERFASNAPAKVIEAEQNKKADAEAKIKVLEEGLAKLV